MATLLRKNRLDVYQRIVAAAVQAPSAENSQPWQFVVEGDALVVCLDTSRCLFSDVGHMLSLTAIGACIENSVIAATAEGFRAEVDSLAELMPTRAASPRLPIARIRFAEGARRDPLVDCIETRCTARRMDHRRQLEAALLDELRMSCESFSDVAIHWVDRARVGEFARLVGIGNRIRFEHKPFHQELYESLRFTPDEAQQTRDGLDIATLQLPSVVAVILAALRSWPRIKCANALGFSRGVARQAAQEVRRSGAVGLLAVRAPEIWQFVTGGRALERIWLAATRLGVCFHPTASLAVFLAHAGTGGQRLAPQHQQLAAEMSQRFQQLFPELTGQTVQMAFRVGFGPAPPVRSLRRPVSSVLG